MRSLMLVRVFPSLVIFICAAAVVVAYPSTAIGASELPEPPAGGLTQGIAGTTDPVALAAAQSFDVQVIWVLDRESQRWLIYVPGASAVVNTLTADSLAVDSVVTIRRTGVLGAREEAPSTGTRPPASGDGNQFTAPPVGGFVHGLAGTNDPARLVARQSFSVESVFALDVPSQRWLVYVPDAPAVVNSLHTGTLRADSIVTVRRAAPSQPAPTATPPPSNTNSGEALMVALVNEERSARGLPQLVIDPALADVARVHSADMWARDYFSHTNPDGLSPFDRIRDAGISYRRAAENIARARSVQRAHELLMNSDGHRTNILRPNYGRIGIGIVSTSQGEMITQLFAN